MEEKREEPCYTRDGTTFCFQDRQCLHGYSLGHFLGRGDYGDVFADGPVVIKVVPLNTWIPFAPDCVLSDPATYEGCSKVDLLTFRRQVSATHITGQLRLGPRLIDAWTCRARNECPPNERVDRDVLLGIIVTERVPGVSLSDWVSEHGWSPEVQEAVERLMQQWRQAHWQHGDLHPRNILVHRNASTGALEARAIDTGDAIFAPPSMPPPSISEDLAPIKIILGLDEGEQDEEAVPEEEEEEGEASE